MRTPAEEKTISQFEIAQFRNSSLGGSKGVEPSTTAFTVRCSARLSYDPQKRLSIYDCQGPIENSEKSLDDFRCYQSAIGNWQSRIINSLAGTTRLELANQLIEGQPAFHLAFIPETNCRIAEFYLKVRLCSWGGIR